MTRPDSQTEIFLALSLEQYLELLQHAESLLKMLNVCDYSQVGEQSLKLQQLQDVAGQLDEQLFHLFKADLDTWKENTLYQKRLDYMASILELNELIVPKIRGVMAVASVELKKMHSGRTALAGYASRTSKQRGHRGIG